MDDEALSKSLEETEGGNDLSTRVRASAVRPDMAHPMWLSSSMIFSIDEGSRRGEVTRFSTARMTPSEVWIPIAVDPS